jgi:hypothetical protein
MRTLATSLVAGLLLASCGGGGQSPADATTTADAVPRDSLPTSGNFSFFVTSYKALRELSGSAAGFGGDLRYGETGPGAGLRGADKLCTTIAERSMPGSGAKQWRAFLSATADDNGAVVNAIDRIGNGPWFDRIGRTLALTKTGLANTRPVGGDVVIADDFPNEDGVPNHDPDGTGDVDNHDMLTGSTTDGMLEDAGSTCLDWTAAAGNKLTEGQPRVGHSWPRIAPDLATRAGLRQDINSWMSSLIESGCAPGVNLIETGPPSPDGNTVGDGGGYGGFYCFALEP